MEADSVEFQNQNSQNSATINENQIPSFRDHGDKGEYFAQKLKEIDKDLSVYEEPSSTEFHPKESSPFYDMENLRSELAFNDTVTLTPPLVNQNHAGHAAPLREISNYSPAPTCSRNLPQTKWKRILRVSLGSAPSTEEHIGAKHSIDMTDNLCELPCKKFLVSHEHKENFPLVAEAVFQPCQEQ